MDLKMELNVTQQMRALIPRIGIGLLVLAVSAYVVVVWPLRNGVKMDAELAETRAAMERQRALQPSLQALAATQNATLNAFLPPKAEPVDRAKAYQLPDQLSQMARAVGAEPLDVTLNAASLAQDPTSIQLQGLFSGQMEAIRALLMNVAGMPSLARMERVEMRAVEGRLEMMLQVRIALAN